jgi:hypothetical protein
VMTRGSREVARCHSCRSLVELPSLARHGVVARSTCTSWAAQDTPRPCPEPSDVWHACPACPPSRSLSQFVPHGGPCSLHREPGHLWCIFRLHATQTLLVRRMVGCHGLAQMLRCSLAAPLLHFPRSAWVSGKIGVMCPMLHSASLCQLPRC